MDRLFFLEFAEFDFVSIQAYWPLIEISHGFSVESLKTAAILIFHEFVEDGGCGLNWPQNESSDRNVKVNGWNVGTAISQNLEGLEIGEQYTISFRYPAGYTNKGLKVALEGFGSARPVKYPASRKPQNNSIHARLSKRRRREFDDWLELCNADSEPANLSGLFLPADPDNPSRYPIPNRRVIPLKRFLPLWGQTDCQSKTDARPQLAPSTSKLRSKGESLKIRQPGKLRQKPALARPSCKPILLITRLLKKEITDPTNVNR